MWHVEKINQSSWPLELNDEVYKVENFAKVEQIVILL